MRWEALVEYRDGSSQTLQFEEFADLGEMIESGPDWHEIVKFEVRLLRRVEGDE